MPDQLADLIDKLAKCHACTAAAQKDVEDRKLDLVEADRRLKLAERMLAIEETKEARARHDVDVRIDAQIHCSFDDERRDIGEDVR